MIEQSSKYHALALMSMLITATLLTSLTTSQQVFATTNTGIMIPLYTYPGTTWDTVIATKNAHPSVPIVAIINPNSGPGNSKDTNYVTGIQNLQSAGVVVIGYVATGYGSRSSSTVQADINTYKSWYPQINGIFFDEMSNSGGDETYYQNLSNYAKSVGFIFTVGNPGTETLPSYVGTMDNIIIYETGGLPSLTSLGGWHTEYDKSNFSFLAYGVGTLSTTFVQNAANYVSYMYITNDNLSNPWDSVTPYFSDLAAALDTGIVTTPPTPSLTQTITVQSKDLSGNTITGLWTEISSNDVLVNSGYTTLTYEAVSGIQYQVCVSNYQNYVFDHWENGSTDSCRMITPTQATTLTASYQTGTTQTSTTHTIKIQSKDLSGKKITGLWTEIYSGTKLVKSGYTTLSYTATTNMQYKVCVSNYQNYVFDHWNGGSTNSCKTITPTSDITLTAFYMR
jgi:hypothetical protein